MEVVSRNAGVRKLSAIAFGFHPGPRGAPFGSLKYIEAKAFCIDLQNPVASLLMFPLPSKVFIMSFDRTRSSPSSCCANHRELQEIVFAETKGPRPTTFQTVPWATERRRSR